MYVLEGCRDFDIVCILVVYVMVGVVFVLKCVVIEVFFLCVVIYVGYFDGEVNVCQVLFVKEGCQWYVFGVDDVIFDIVFDGILRFWCI